MKQRQLSVQMGGSGTEQSGQFAQIPLLLRVKQKRGQHPLARMRKEQGFGRCLLFHIGEVYSLKREMTTGFPGKAETTVVGGYGRMRRPFGDRQRRSGYRKRALAAAPRPRSSCNCLALSKPLSEADRAGMPADEKPNFWRQWLNLPVSHVPKSLSRRRPITQSLGHEMMLGGHRPAAAPARGIDSGQQQFHDDNGVNATSRRSRSAAKARHARIWSALSSLEQHLPDFTVHKTAFIGQRATFRPASSAKRARVSAKRLNHLAAPWADRSAMKA